MLNFIDAYLRYNQIRMYPPNTNKISFLTEGLTFVTKSCPLSLKEQE